MAKSKKQRFKEKQGFKKFHHSNEKSAHGVKLKLKKKVSNTIERQRVKARKKGPNLSFSSSHLSAKKLKNLSLKERMLERLKSSRFRYLNEQLYVTKGKDAMKYFSQDKKAFQAYHEGYQQQIQQWPLNPLQIVIESIKPLARKDVVIADFGCGDAEIAKTFPQLKVHSFDLVALDPCVTACDMSHTPLDSATVDIVVFCLSLMGTNLNDFIIEANRVLKVGGLMKIAEVESRFERVEHFIQELAKFGFTNTFKNFTHDLFYFMDFKKERNIGKNSKKKLPTLTLKACLYKKR